MPNRYIREGILTSEAVASLKWPEEVFYRRLLNRVDDFGRFHAHPSLLRAALYPLQLDAVRETDIPRWLAACEQAGLMYVYSVDGKRYLALNKWEKGRATRSSYPDPPPEITASLSGRECLASGGKFSGSDGGLGDLGSNRSQAGSARPRITSDPDIDIDPDNDTDTKDVSLCASKARVGGKAVPHPKSAEEVAAYAGSLRPTSDMRLLPDEGFCAWFFDTNDGVGWVDDKGHPIRDWRATFRASWRGRCHRDQENERRAANRQNGNNRGYSHAPRQKPGDDEKF